MSVKKSNDFSVGDKVIYLSPGNKHDEKEGEIISRHNSPFENIRWKIRFDDPNVTPIFVIDEKQLEHAVQYKRDKKIKDLGI